LWRNRLVVWLDSSQMICVQLSGFGKQVLYKQHTKFDASPDLGWSQPLNALQDTLRSTKQLMQAELEVILASDFVRYLALPAYEGIIRQSHKVDFARAAYREVYGSVAEEWLIQCDDAAPGLTTIAAAIDTTLLDALNKIANEYKMRLASVQPYLMPVFNRLKPQLSTGPLYFAIIESNRILFANIQNGRWQQLRSFLLETDWQSQIKIITQRANLLADSQQQHVLLIYAPNDKKSSLPNIQGWLLRRVDFKSSWIQSKAENQDFGMLEIA
jgi:hypothetical protein